MSCMYEVNDIDQNIVHYLSLFNHLLLLDRTCPDQIAGTLFAKASSYLSYLSVDSLVYQPEPYLGYFILFYRYQAYHHVKRIV